MRAFLIVLLLAAPAYADEYLPVPTGDPMLDGITRDSNTAQQRMNAATDDTMRQIEQDRVRQQLQEQQRQLDAMRAEQDRARHELERCRAVGGC
jgi:hypothetical protein